MKNKKGFTLIELLIAMSIISLIAMAFFTIVNSTIRGNSRNEKNIKCANIAQSEIENIRQQIKDLKDSSDKNIKVKNDITNEIVIIPVTTGLESEIETSNIPKIIENDNNTYYENIIVSREQMEYSRLDYLYTITVVVHYDAQALSEGRGKGFTTQVFSKQ